MIWVLKNLSHCDRFFEHPQDMFWLRNKNFFDDALLTRGLSLNDLCVFVVFAEVHEWFNTERAQ